MRFLPIAAALIAAVLIAATPLAARADSFSPAQRAEIIAILREALRTDPTILRDAVTAMQAQSQAAQAAQSRALIASNSDALLHDPSDQVAGNPRGDVSLVEFYDPRCQYCRRILPDLDALLKADPNVRLVYKDIPILSEQSAYEAKAILAAKRQGGYLRMQAALMTDSGPGDEATVRAAAQSSGLDANRLLHDMNDPAILDQINRNLTLAHALHVGGTPAIVVGGTMIPGAVNVPQLQAAVAEARKHSS